MPWFETPFSAKDGKWGQHWTMANRNPDIQDSTGKRQIASWFYPLIGPYSSSDPDVIQYHLLLMKYAGIDGVIADWYGTHPIFDYALIKNNTDSLLLQLQAAGLQFAVCYEDRTLIKNRLATGKDIIGGAREDITYLSQSYFPNPAYIHINGRPLLLCFGVETMHAPWIWDKAFSQTNTKPWLVCLWYMGEKAGYMSAGEFAWINKDHLKSLNNFYQLRAPHSCMAGAYPGFKDFYNEGGWGSTLFTITHINTLATTLQLAKKSGLSILQLNTWNDFGEGTMLEPTREFGFSSLVAIQEYAGVIYGKCELELIFHWYQLKKKYLLSQKKQQLLQQAYYYLISLQTDNAEKIIRRID